MGNKTITYLSGVLTAAIAVGMAVTAPAASAAETTTSTYKGVATTAVSQPAAGSRNIYVDDTGSDILPVNQPWGHVDYSRITCLDTGVKPGGMPSCPEPDINHPLRTIQGAVKIAKPGDVIVVRAGRYDERIGWGARAGRADARIVMQAYPNERVQVDGYLSLTGADYWTVSGLHFGYSPTNTTGQSVVYFAGGVGWSFLNNEVTGTKGVANVMVIGKTPTDGSSAAMTAAAPRNYTIAANCIREAASVGTKGQMHNIYLMPTIYSSGGLIENNLIGDAPLGANIKAAGSTDPAGSPRNVLIKNNTLVNGSSGLIVGQMAQGIETQGNLIANTGAVTGDGGIRTYDLSAPGTNSIKDTYIAGYSAPIKYQWGQAQSMYERRNATASSVQLTGWLGNCTLKAANATVASTYGNTVAK
ncbi:MAG: hypothetical protein JWO93_774 [Micrococcaceae bacterium]|nr:hypothetical protein [Micrococcaceae bacterium]